ncbi:MAG: hypothetical protein JSV92_01825 [archaeon]|nr:MAG: hypothetical protein JSV92_01825 [archaeon]
MKVGWQLKEEVPLFIILLVVVSALMYYMGAYEPMVSFGTGFLVAAIVTSLEVIVHAMQNKGKAPKVTTKAAKKK